eukprot:g5317.t1
MFGNKEGVQLVLFDAADDKLNYPGQTKMKPAATAPAVTTPATTVAATPFLHVFVINYYNTKWLLTN